MSRYRKTMSEAMAEVQKISEAGYLEPKMNPRQIQNIKKIWQFKTKKDLTPAVIKMIKNMDPVTQGAIKDAGINLLSDIAEGRMSEIDAMQKAGKSAAEIAKLMKLPVKTVKAILGEQETDSAQDMQDVKPGKDKIKEDEDKDLEEFIDDIKNNTPNSEQFDEEKKKKKDDVAPDNDVPVEVKEQEDQSKEVDKLKKELEKSREQTVAIKQKAQMDATKQAQKSRAASDKMVNPETGEPLLQVGIAYKHLKAKMEKEKKEEEQKQRSAEIAKLGKDKPKLKEDELDMEEVAESAASDKAKGMGLDYMKFGRYGKDGKVTHKTQGDNLVKVGKGDEPKSDKPAPKKPEAGKKSKPKEADDVKIKSKNFLKDLDNGKLKDADGDEINLDFYDELSFDAAIDKAREMGLDDLTSRLEDIASYVADAEIENAEAEFLDLKAELSGKPAKDLEKMKIADKQMELFNDQEYSPDNLDQLVDDLMPLTKTLVDMANANEIEGSPGSGMQSSSRGFRDSVLGTIQSTEEISNTLRNVADETNDEEIADKLEEIAGEFEFCWDENSDHDGYTKSGKVNSALEAALDSIKDLKKLQKKKGNAPDTRKPTKKIGDMIKNSFDYNDPSSIEDAIEFARKNDESEVAEDLESIMAEIEDDTPKNEIQMKMQDKIAELTNEPLMVKKYLEDFEDTSDRIQKRISDNYYEKELEKGTKVFNDFGYDIKRFYFELRNMIDNDDTEGSPGSSAGSGSKALRPDVIESMNTFSELYKEDENGAAFNKFIDKIENTKRRKTIKDLMERLSELMYDFSEESDNDEKFYSKERINSSLEDLKDVASKLESNFSLVDLYDNKKVDKITDESRLNYVGRLIMEKKYKNFKEELNKDDEKVIKKVKDMLKGASDKHAAQAKMIDKALKNEMKKDDAYAIGMAQAKKVMNDEPPLQKKTIKKGHEIADKILKKEEIKEFKKMKVTIRDMDKRKKAIADLMKQNLGVSVNGGVIKVDGKGKDLNNFAKDLMNFYGANVVAEETIEEGITPQMIATLKKEYEPFRGKKISAARARQLMNILNKFKDSDLQKLGKENIPFISSGSRSKLAVRNMKFTVKNIEFGEELDEEMFEACWTGYKQVGMKKKGNKQVPNCVPEAVKKENAPSEADIERLKKQGMKPRKEQKDHPAAAVYESIAAVKKKAEKTGMPYSVLKKVYDRGMAAWRGGHRPGATQVQWALARVNSFVTKSSGTWGGADKDLAKKVKGK